MRLLVLALLCWAAAAASAVQAGPRTDFQARCEDTMGDTLSVLTGTQNGFRIDNTVGFRSLTAMKGKAPNQKLNPGQVVLGLTRTESRVSINVGGRLLSDPASGYECIAPHIEIKLYYPPIVVYISREFRPGSCAYEEVLAHEMRHLNAYLDYLPKAEARVRLALERRFEEKPLYARIGQAQSLLQREIDRGWMPYIKSEMAKVEALQAAIDSPQEYARLGKVCGGEVQSLLRPVQKRKQ
ncbi:membrane protein [Massilia sp. BSC265]|nr:membrane protein [Massilia sp. BSC265]